MMTQTIAIFIDAYRALNAKKLFWITLVLSALVVAAFACVGLTPTGVQLLIWEIDSPLNTEVIPEDVFYKTLFTSLGIGFWLAWIASILALVSTAGIFPDMLTEGAIDLVLSKPIGRVRLFLTKYLTGLLFVALQVTVFCAASFLVLGLRGGTWEPGVFVAIPIVLVFFSYLFSICALIGVVTRSTIAALLLTLLFWFMIFGLHSAESITHVGRVGAELKVEALEEAIATREARLEDLRGSADETDRIRVERLETNIAERETSLDAARGSAGTWTTIHRIAFAFKTILPKTTETIALVERSLVDLADLPAPDEDDLELDPEQMSFGNIAAQTEAAEQIRERPVSWVIGTSLVFEALMLALAGWVFARRDY